VCSPPVLVTADFPQQNKWLDGRQYPLKRAVAIFLLAFIIRLLVIAWPVLVKKALPPCSGPSRFASHFLWRKTALMPMPMDPASALPLTVSRHTH
jgi:hypothetical protein